MWTPLGGSLTTRPPAQGKYPDAMNRWVRQLGCHQPDVQPLPDRPKGHVHDQRHRERQQRLPSPEPRSHGLSQRRESAQSTLSGDLGATKKWTMPVQNWGQVYAELNIMYPGRFTED